MPSEMYIRTEPKLFLNIYTPMNYIYLGFLSWHARAADEISKVLMSLFRSY